MATPTIRERLTRDPLWLAVRSLFVLVPLLAGAGWYYAGHYRPLVMGSAFGGLDTRSAQAADGTYTATIQYDAGKTWSYPTSVRNNGRWAIDLTGADLEPEPRVAGSRSDCEYSVACLRSASWSYGVVSTRKLSDADRDAWRPFGSVHLEPGEEVMVRLTYVFGRCAQDNQGTVGYLGWQATYSFFGNHKAFVPFASPVQVLPLPVSEQKLPADCPRTQ